MKDNTKENILIFWFEDHGPEDWYKKDDGFDQEIREKFFPLYESLKDGNVEKMIETPATALAYIILFDQFPRNMFRGTPQAFARDDLALSLAKLSVARGYDQEFENTKRAFFYIPFMHSEDINDQKECVRLCKNMDKEGTTYEYAVKHLEVIEKFGRFPHRNEILDRKNTTAEEEYLSRPDAGF